MQDAVRNPLGEGDYVVWTDNGEVARVLCIAGEHDWQTKIVLTRFAIELAAPYKNVLRFVVRRDSIILHPDQGEAEAAFDEQRAAWRAEMRRREKATGIPAGMALTRFSAVAGRA